MKTHHVTPLLFLVAHACLAPMALAATSYFQGWDVANDLAGWTANTLNTTVVVVNAGGNPNGYLESSRDPIGAFPIGAKSDLPDVSGDYAAAGITRVSFDVRFQEGTFFSAVFRVRYLDPAHNGWFIPFTSDYTPGVWKAYTINFDPTWTDAQALAAGWLQESTSATFAQTFANVYTPEIRIDGSGLPLVAGIDNFRICNVSPSGACGPTAARNLTWGQVRNTYR